MVIIKNAELNTTDYEQFKKMVLDKWGTVEQLADNEDLYQLPMPLLAYYNIRLAGGLSFSHYKSPEKDVDSIWINTVYIDQKYRRKGIASLLIIKAEEVLKSTESEIFVFTDKPNLYKKLGWEIVSQKEKDFVLKRSLLP
ncbi:MAG: GNAT family N-acetyltransferase [Spirochaetaceae bacterium]